MTNIIGTLLLLLVLPAVLFTASSRLYRFYTVGLVLGAAGTGGYLVLDLLAGAYARAAFDAIILGAYTYLGHTHE